jgi:hypothetical protein
MQESKKVENFLALNSNNKVLGQNAIVITVIIPEERQ